MRLQHRCFPVNFATFLRTFFYRASSGPGDYFLNFNFLQNIFFRVYVLKQTMKIFIPQQYKPQNTLAWCSLERSMYYPPIIQQKNFFIFVAIKITLFCACSCQSSYFLSFHRRSRTLQDYRMIFWLRSLKWPGFVFPKQ